MPGETLDQLGTSGPARVGWPFGGDLKSPKDLEFRPSSLSPYRVPNRIQKRQVSEKLNMASQLVQILSNKLVFLKNISNSLLSGTNLLPYFLVVCKYH